MKPQKKHIIKKQAGYTMVEILVVISIIGILAAIALPNFTGYKIRSYDTAAKSDLYNLFATCVSHWTEKTNSSPCSLSVATSASYGFISSDGVLLIIDDDSHDAFHATSRHDSSDKTYEVGTEGYITLQ